MKSLLSKLKKKNAARRKEKKEDDKPFPLLQLPREIRDQIYLCVFGNQGVQIVPHGDSKLTYSRCLWATPPAASRYFPQHRGPFPDPWMPQEISGDQIPAENASLNISVLYASKQIYNEASRVLYSTLCFQADEVPTWLRFANSVNSKHLAMVKSLRTCWVSLACLTEAPVPPEQTRRYAKYENYTTLSDGGFQEFWDLAATRMVGLVDLGFVMEYTGHYLSRSTSALWVNELLRVKGLGRFELEIWDRRSTQETTDEEMAVLTPAQRNGQMGATRQQTQSALDVHQVPPNYVQALLIMVPEAIGLRVESRLDARNDSNGRIVETSTQQYLAWSAPVESHKGSNPQAKDRLQHAKPESAKLPRDSRHRG